MKSLYLLAALLVLFGGAYVLRDTYDVRAWLRDITSSEETETAPTFTWRIETAARYPEGELPTQYISLVSAEHVYPIGEYVGCSEQPNLDLLSGEITRLTCWYAGGGYDLSVFHEDGQYFVKKRWTQEVGGENAEPYGPFETLFPLQ